MIRRTARLRREFIYRKSLEGKERELYEKKRTIRQCLEAGAYTRSLQSST
jgi:U3 small nucleolar ribonucleoprotein protein IMP4